MPNTRILLINNNIVYKAILHLALINGKLVIITWIYHNDSRLHIFKMVSIDNGWMIVETAELPDWLLEKEGQLSDGINNYLKSLEKTTQDSNPLVPVPAGR